MKGNFTENDILRIVYDEINPDCNQVKKELDANPDLRAFYHDMLEMKKKLDKVRLHPDHSSVNIILEHSNSFSSLEASG